jgi:arginase
MQTTIIQVPYDSGHYGKRMGRGPLHLVESGIFDRLEAKGHDVQITPIRLDEDFTTEVGSAAELHKLVAQSVRSAPAEGRLPLILSGNCNTAIGTLAGIGADKSGVLWFDAHGDFNTPETSRSGFFDGMALCTLTGRCWRRLASGVPGFSPVAEHNVALIGARDLDPEEKRLLKDSEITCVGAGAIRQNGGKTHLEPFLDELHSRVSQVYLHIDLDVLDPAEARVNQFSAPGGLSAAEVIRIIEAAGRRFEIAAAALTAYDPEYDHENRALEAAERIINAIVRNSSIRNR